MYSRARQRVRSMGERAEASTEEDFSFNEKGRELNRPGF